MTGKDACIRRAPRQPIDDVLRRRCFRHEHDYRRLPCRIDIQAGAAAIAAADTTSRPPGRFSLLSGPLDAYAMPLSLISRFLLLPMLTRRLAYTS